MRLDSRRRRGIASVIGTVFFVLVLMGAFGALAYMASLQAQSTQVAQQAQSVAAGKADELLLYSTPSPGLTMTDSGPTTTKVIAMVLKFENGSVYSLNSASSPSFASATFPQGTNALVQSLVPTSTSPCKDQNNVGTATCLSKFNSIVNSVVAGRSAGLVTSLGNTFWYVPSTSLLTWSSITNFPPGCAVNQYVTALGTTLTCSQVGWAQLTGYPSPCASNQYVSAYGATLTCSSISLPWSQLTSFPSACPAGQFISSLGTTPTCGASGPTTVRTTSSVTTSGTTPKSTGLLYALSANTNYAFVAYTNVICGTCIEKFDFQIHALPSGASLQIACTGATGETGANLPGGCVTSTGANIHNNNPFSFGATGETWVVLINGIVTVGSSSGNLQIDIACVSGCGSVTLQSGAFMTVYQTSN
jgi:hypothetical protein